MPPKVSITTTIDDLGRRRFQLAHDEEQSEEEDYQQYQEEQRHCSTLIRRQQSLNIEHYIGRKARLDKKQPTEVFFCSVCQVGFKCDTAYLVHVNSPMHNRKLGMNMKVKAVSVSSVAEKIKALNAKKEDKNAPEEVTEAIQPEELPNQALMSATEANSSQEKKEQDGIQKAKLNDQSCHESQQSQEIDPQIALMQSLGLPTSFGSKRVKR